MTGQSSGGRKTRRQALAALALAATAPFPGRAQAPRTGPARIAVLSPGVADQRGVFEAFRSRLRELGRLEGRDIAIEFHFARGMERLPELAAGIRAAGADVVVTDGQGATMAMHATGCLIPIVAVAGFDPVQRGVAASMARPGGCVTGVAVLADQIGPKGLELLREIVPAARRIGVFYATIDQPTQDALVARAAALKVELRHIVVTGAAEVQRQLAPSAISDLDGLVQLPGPLLAGLAATIVPILSAIRMPVVFSDRDFVAAGGLAVHGYDIFETFRQLAGYVDRILRGARVGDLPFEQPARIELVVNLATARAMGIELPPLLLARADEVIE